MVTKEDYRLSTAIRPVNYDVTLTPDLERFTFAGAVSIALEVDEPTGSITLHASELEVQEAGARLPDGTVVPARDWQEDETFETLTFTFDRELPAGQVALDVRFTGTLNDQLRGFYRARYQDEQGRDRYLATTQFEATDARRAFPCWDDPAVKATFDVTLVAPAGQVAISNMPEHSREDRGGGATAVRFKRTPRMSTYYLVFIVGDMASVEAPAANGVTMRVWATRGKEEQGRFALENAVRLLDYYNDYFGIPYPLEKMDHIAVPDFAAGAMENWGGITYRETALLFDPDNSAAAARQRILEVVAHEMAHMWFGDLVTMEWWDDLWLNESFATMMGDKAVDALYPEWDMWTQFVSHDTNRALSLDGLRNSHPIEANVKDPAEIRELFDAISYSKGGAVLRMLEHFLSEETFRKGVSHYLKQHAYGNAQTRDLWAALEEVSGRPVVAVMDAWVKQTGYPLLEVRTERSNGGLAVHLQQRRFLYDHLLDGSDGDPTRWPVPVTVTSDRGGHLAVLMEGEQATVAVPDADWVKVNALQAGFFRTSYAADTWPELRRAVAGGTLSQSDRLGLQNDAYALVRAGMAAATTFLELAEAYRGEDDGTVWGDLAANLRGLETLIQDEPYHEQFSAFARGLFQGAAARVGWERRADEGHLDALKRSTLLAQAGAYGDPAVIAEAQARFARYVHDPASVPPDLRGVVLGLAAQEGDSDTFELLWSLERQAQLQEEKMRFLGAVARFRDRGLLQENLGRALNPTEVRVQDTVLLVGAIGANRHGRDLVWEFIKEHWPELDRRYGKGGFAITNLVSVTGSFTTLERAREVEEFFSANPAPSAARTIQQSLERIRLNHAWLERNSEGLAAWFASR